MSRPVKGHQAQTGLQPLSIPLCLVAPPLVAQNVTLLARVAFRGALQPSAPPTVVWPVRRPVSRAGAAVSRGPTWSAHSPAVVAAYRLGRAIYRDSNRWVLSLFLMECRGLEIYVGSFRI
jgi:hypothetical protein